MDFVIRAVAYAILPSNVHMSSTIGDGDINPIKAEGLNLCVLCSQEVSSRPRPPPDWKRS